MSLDTTPVSTLLRGIEKVQVRPREIIDTFEQKQLSIESLGEFFLIYTT